jgi:hypothetical protein
MGRVDQDQQLDQQPEQQPEQDQKLEASAAIAGKELRVCPAVTG